MLYSLGLVAWLLTSGPGGLTGAAGEAPGRIAGFADRVFQKSVSSPPHLRPLSADEALGQERSPSSAHENPRQHPRGIPYVVVNGVLVKELDRHTGALPGRTLRRIAPA